RIPRRSTTRLRGIFRAAKKKRRCPRRSSGAEFHRDARQNRVANISGKKEARSPPRRFVARYLFAALHHGYVYAHPLFHSGKTCLPAESTCLRRPNGINLGIDFQKLTGREAIVNALIPFLGPLDTSHTVSNLQIENSDDSAILYAYVMSQHFMPREGCRRGSENALLMNRYDCELVRDGQKWRFRRVTIDNAWAQGNPEILNALAIQRTLAAKSRQSK